MIALDVSLAIT